jgi:hypothetical protein
MWRRRRRFWITCSKNMPPLPRFSNRLRSNAIIVRRRFESRRDYRILAFRGLASVREQDISGLIQKVFRQPGSRLALAPEILRNLTVHVDCGLPYSIPQQVIYEGEQGTVLASRTLALNRSYSFASSNPTVDLNRGVYPPACKFQNC